MSKFVRIAEIFLLIACIVAFGFIFNLELGYTTIFRILIILYALLHFLFPFTINRIKSDTFKKKGLKSKLKIELLLVLSFSYIFAIVLLGIMGKITHLSFSSYTLYYFSYLFLIIGIIIFFYYLFTRTDLLKNVFLRIVVIGVVWSLFQIIPKEFIIDYRYRNYPDYLNIYYKSRENPDSVELQIELLNERNKIYNIKNKGR